MAKFNYRVAKFDENTSGDTTILQISTIVSSLTSNIPNFSTAQKERLKIRVVSLCYNSFGDVEVALKSGSSVVIDPAKSMAVNGNFFVFNGTKEQYYVETQANEDLVINLSDAVRVTGIIGYYIV